LAIREGRVTYANMGKFINYIFASKVSELLPFSRYCHPAHPLTPTIVQILAVDLAIYLLPTHALSAMPPSPTRCVRRGGRAPADWTPRAFCAHMRFSLPPRRRAGDAGIRRELLAGSLAAGPADGISAQRR
jgi:magnesium-transporting ATPase (P-type)